MTSNSRPRFEASASVETGGRTEYAAKIRNRYQVQCFDPSGLLVWEDWIDNLIPTVGLNKLIDAALKSGSGAPTWYVGLKSAGTVAAGDTMASHGGWTELTSYSEATRPAFASGSVVGGSIDNVASPSIFSVNGSMTVAGCFMVNQNTKAGTTGDLYGVGDFATAKSVLTGDTLRVQIICSVVSG
jgi:hypothetical protein